MELVDIAGKFALFAEHWRPKLVAELVQMGARYVSTGTDLAFLLAESAARAKQVQEMALE